MRRRQQTSELLGRDIASTMRYTVDPRVGSLRKKPSAMGRQADGCYDGGLRTRKRTNAIRPAEPASTLVAAQQIAVILVRFAEWLSANRGEGTSLAL